MWGPGKHMSGFEGVEGIWENLRRFERTPIILPEKHLSRFERVCGYLRGLERIWALRAEKSFEVIHRNPRRVWRISVGQQMHTDGGGGPLISSCSLTSQSVYPPPSRGEGPFLKTSRVKPLVAQKAAGCEEAAGWHPRPILALSKWEAMGAGDGLAGSQLAAWLDSPPSALHPKNKVRAISFDFLF